MDRLAGGFDAKLQETAGSYSPYATTLFDPVRRGMPFDAPRSLTPDRTFAACAHVAYLDGLVPETAVLDARTLPRVEMLDRFPFASAFSHR